MFLLETKEPDRSVPCLDMVHVTWCGERDSACCDDAILLEVSPKGGMLHAGLTMPNHQEFVIHTEAGKFPARVNACEFDNHGFVVRFTVESQTWFPRGFQPANLKETIVSNRMTSGVRRRKRIHAA